MAKKNRPVQPEKTYEGLVENLSTLVDGSRSLAIRTVNSVLTATYWEMGRRIVEFEQGGQPRAGYGEELLARLGSDLTARLGRGFSARNLRSMRGFFLGWNIWQTPSAKLQARAKLPKEENISGKQLEAVSNRVAETSPEVFPLPWSHYVRLLSVENPQARRFYEEEAIRGSWSVRQLERQIDALFYERSALSKNKTAMLKKGQRVTTNDVVRIEEAIRDPLVLEFLNLRDEYSENDLESAIVQHLESFLLELGDDFTFVARQKRLRLDDEWFRVDLVFFHRVLRCLLIVDLKLGKYTHADAGQMHMYLNYAKEHWMKPGENPPVGLILCARKGHDVARYTLAGLSNKVLAGTYLTKLPNEELLLLEIERTRRMLELNTPREDK